MVYNSTIYIQSNIVKSIPSEWNIYFSAITGNHQLATGIDGNDYLISSMDEIQRIPGNVSTKANIGALSGPYQVTNGFRQNTDENASFVFSMESANVPNLLANQDGPYTMFVVYTWDGNTNDLNYKKWIKGKKGWKIEGPDKINIADSFINGTVTSNGQTFTFPLTMNNTSPYFICITRTTTQYKIYVGEIISGNDKSDLVSVSSSPWVLNIPFSHTTNDIEFKVDEGSILHAWGYAKLEVSTTSVQDTYEFLINEFA